MLEIEYLTSRILKVLRRVGTERKLPALATKNVYNVSQAVSLISEEDIHVGPPCMQLNFRFELRKLTQLLLSLQLHLAQGML